MPELRSLLGVSGHVELILTRRDGYVRRHEGSNLVIDGGLNLMVQHLGNASANPIGQMICGSDNTWPSPPGSITALNNVPVSSVAKTLSGGQITYPTPTTGQAIIQFSATWAETENNAFTIYEIGLFAAGPLLVARYVLPSPGVTKLSLEQLVINYSILVNAV